MIFPVKNKNNKLAGLLLGILACVYASCIDDKGNYSYREINAVEISGIEKSYSVYLGQSLKITPSLSFSISETQDSFKYEWHLMTGSSNKISGGLLSAEKNLDIIVGNPIPGDGSYDVIYCVTNITTGVRYDCIFTLNVRDRMQTGYIMLCERENNSFDIDLISLFNDTLTQYHNLLDFYESKLPRTGCKPLDLVCYCDPASPTLAADGKKKYAIWILTDKGTERVRIENFEWKPEFNISGISSVPEKFLQGEPLIAEKMVAPVVNLLSEAVNWIYCRGNWYWYNFPGMTTYFYLSPVNAPSYVGAPYKAAPYIVSRAQSAALLFNEDANRFEYQYANSSGNSANVLRTNRLSADNTHFNWENPDYRLIYMGNRDFSIGFAVVKNVSSNKYELLLMDILDTSVRKLGRAEFPAGLALEDVKFFTFHNSMPYLYCATEDKLYRINTTAMQQWDDITSSVLPAGHKISRMKNSAFRFPANRRIIVATYDPAGQAGKNGQLALYNVQDGTGDLILAKHPDKQTEAGYQIDMKWTGFGKIINIDYKDPK
ncbi:MAG: hypothetical protein LBH32_06265 [Dysgonamonadaceae bacterium]|jgi:hypothetical protein|nr:hypothetical protein [Dysgonamonadaceae bacterium]